MGRLKGHDGQRGPWACGSPPSGLCGQCQVWAQKDALPWAAQSRIRVVGRQVSNSIPFALRTWPLRPQRQSPACFGKSFWTEVGHSSLTYPIGPRQFSTAGGLTVCLGPLQKKVKLHMGWASPLRRGSRMGASFLNRERQLHVDLCPCPLPNVLSASPMVF